MPNGVSGQKLTLKCTKVSKDKRAKTAYCRAFWHPYVKAPASAHGHTQSISDQPVTRTSLPVYRTGGSGKCWHHTTCKQKKMLTLQYTNCSKKKLNKHYWTK